MHLITTQERQAKIFMKVMDMPEGIYTDLTKQFAKRGIPISRSVMKREDLDPLRLHPLVNKAQHLHWTFWSAEEELQGLRDSVSELTEEQLSNLKIPEFMPQVDYGPYLGFKRQESRTRASLIRRLCGYLL